MDKSNARMNRELKKFWLSPNVKYDNVDDFSYLISAVSLKKQKSIIKKYPVLITYIKNPHESIQMMAVTKNFIYVKQIDNPSYNVQLYVVQQEYSYASHIKNIDPEILALAILMGYKN